MKLKWQYYMVVYFPSFCSGHTALLKARSFMTMDRKRRKIQLGTSANENKGEKGMLIADVCKKVLR